MKSTWTGNNLENQLGTSQTKAVTFGEDEPRPEQAAQERRHPDLHQLAAWPYTLGS